MIRRTQPDTMPLNAAQECPYLGKKVHQKIKNDNDFS